MSSTFKLYLLGFIFLIIIMVGVYFAGKNNSENKPPKNEIVPDDDDFGTDKLSNLEKYQITEIIDNIYEDIEGYNFYRDSDKLAKLILISDTLFVAAWNYWNNKYYTKNGMDLKEALEDESSDLLGDWTKTRKLVLKKINRLIK